MFKRCFFVLMISILTLAFTMSSEAIEVKLDEDTFADFQVQTRVFYLNADKGRYNFGGDYKDYKDYRPNYFEIYKLRFGAKGQINKLISFYANLDSNDNEGYVTKFWEAAIQLNFYPEFVVKAGQIRVPFSRHNFIGRHNSPVMSSDGDYFLAEQFRDALKAVDPYLGGYRAAQLYKRTDRGVMLAGSVKEGLIKYFTGIFIEDRGKENRVWKNTGGFGSVTAGEQHDKKNFEYDIRIEFTPTFWGFVQEPNVFDPSSREYQTYGGKIDTMTFGIGYHHEKHLESADAIYDASSLSRDGYAVDFSFEKKLGKFLTGAELGYMYFDDTHFYQTGATSYKKGDAWTWYGETHMIYREKVGIGFPGIGLRYEYVNVDGEFNSKKDLVYERYGACLSYYPRSKGDKIIDVTNRIGIGFDYVKAHDALKAYINSKYRDFKENDSNFTWYIGIYAQF